MPRRSRTHVTAPLIAAALLMLAVSARAQDSTSTSPLLPGAWALQFRVGQDFTLDSFTGTMLSVKHHLSARTALRLGVSTSLALRDQEVGEDSIVEREMDRDLQTIFVTLQRLRYMTPSHRFNPFWGLGPTVGWRHELSQDLAESAESTGERELTSTSWTAGLTGNLGIEWCPSANIGLHAEYGVFGGYSHVRQESKIEYSTAPDPAPSFTESNVWHVSGQGVLFGLSVYF